MKSIFFLGALVPLIVLVSAPFAYAETVLRTSENVSLSDDQTVNGDFYAAAGTVSLSGMIEGDAHVAAGSVTTNGEVGADLFAVGRTVQVHASVTDDVRIAAGEVVIAEYVGGDVMVFGGVLTILSTAHIEGDIFFYGGEAEISGEVAGSIHGMSEKIRIDGPVGGDIDVRTGMLVLGDRANIDGDIQYQSVEELVRSQNAVIVGDVVRNDLPNTNKSSRELLVPFLVYAFSVLLVLVVFRNHIQGILTSTISNFTRNGLIGLAGIIFIPGVIILSFFTIIGSVVGIIVAFSAIALWMLAMLCVGLLAGQVLLRLFSKSYDVSLLPTLAGVIAVCVISLVPVIGPLALIVATIALFGSFLHLCYQKLA